MKLLQLNAWSIRLGNRVVDMIDQESPDVIAFQEVFDSNSELGIFPTLTEFAGKIKFHHHFFSPVYNFNFMSGLAEFGNAIVSNLTLSDNQTVFTNLEYKNNFSFDEDDYNIRNFQHVIAADQNGKKFHLINHHGYHVPGHKKGNDFTLRACQQISDYASGLDGPIIIVGDFNLEPDSESLAVFDDGFRNLSVEYGLETTRNELTKKSEVCDYIFVNNSVIVQDFYMPQIVASDHQGLVLDFELA